MASGNGFGEVADLPTNFSPSLRDGPPFGRLELDALADDPRSLNPGRQAARVTRGPGDWNGKMSDTFDLAAELAAATGGFLDEAESEAGQGDTVGDVLRRAQDKAGRYDARRAETDYDLARMAAETAKANISDAKAAAARARIEDELAAKRASREGYLAQIDAAMKAARGRGDAEPAALASNAFLQRAQQLVGELDLEIADLDVAAPFAGINDLGTFEEARIKQGGVETGAKRYVAADGLIGKAARDLEDAKVRHAKVIADGYDESTLRAQDAAREVEETYGYLSDLRTEFSRRELHTNRAERRAELATELAVEAATKLDRKARAKIDADREMSAEDRAVAIARLAVPMSERQQDTDTWNGLVEQGMEQAQREQYERILSRALQRQTIYQADDPVMAYLRDGTRITAEEATLRQGDAGRSLRERDPGAVAYLQSVGAVQGLAPLADEDPATTGDPAGELIQSLEANRDARTRQREELKQQREAAWEGGAR